VWGSAPQPRRALPGPGRGEGPLAPPPLHPPPRAAAPAARPGPGWPGHQAVASQPGQGGQAAARPPRAAEPPPQPECPPGIGRHVFPFYKEGISIYVFAAKLGEAAGPGPAEGARASGGPLGAGGQAPPASDVCVCWCHRPTRPPPL